MTKYRILGLGIFVALLWTIISLSACKSDGNAKSKENIAVAQDTSNAENKLLAYYKKNGDYYKLEWPILLRTKFEEKYVDTMGMEVSLPVFTDTLKVLDGKMVEVEGFFIPVSETGDDNIVIVSAYPFAQCFFCGKAGVESIIDILSPKKVGHLKLDAKIKFRGRLKLNRDNFDYLIYVLEEAELVE